MKKRLLVLAAMLVLLAGFVMAQSDTGSITLTGTVAAVVDITVTPQGSYNALDLASDQTNLAVATVNEYSNVAAGYTVAIESAQATANAGEPSLLGDTGGSLDYTVTYDSVPVGFSGGAPLVTDVNAPSATSAGTDKTLAISYTALAANLPAGTYSDTLTLTITGK